MGHDSDKVGSASMLDYAAHTNKYFVYILLAYHYTLTPSACYFLDLLCLYYIGRQCFGTVCKIGHNTYVFLPSRKMVTGRYHITSAYI